MSTKSFNERVTIQFGETRRKVYDDFLAVVKQENVPKSTAGYLLLQKGILHRNNPEALIPKEVEKKVYVDRPVEKVVYKDRPKVIDTPKTEHLSNRIVDSKPKGKQTVNKATQQDTPKDPVTSTSNAWLWCIGGLVVLLGGWKLVSLYTSKQGVYTH